MWRWLVLSLPLLYWLVLLAQGQLGADPAKLSLHLSGLWALRLLWLCLAMTPLKLLTNKNWPLLWRRQLGLASLYYALLHLASYVLLYLEADWLLLLTELRERWFIWPGLMALLVLIPMGLTSNNWSMRRLGAKWKSLHRWVYLAAPLIALHYLWQTKRDLSSPLLYLLLLALLMLFRWKKIKQMLHKWHRKAT